MIQGHNDLLDYLNDNYKGNYIKTINNKDLIRQRKKMTFKNKKY